MPRSVMFSKWVTVLPRTVAAAVANVELGTLFIGRKRIVYIMKKLLFLAMMIFSVLLFVQSAQAYRLTDGMYFAMANDTIKCIDVILPGDSGFAGIGEYEYTLTCSSNWSDLTEQVVRTDENNTVRIPVCFSGFGKHDGECSPPFTIGISSFVLGIEEEWKGGVCISRYPDVDVSDAEPEDEGDVRDILNDNFDLFDAGFSAERMYSEPGEPVVYTLLIESYASLTIDLSAESGIDISPGSETVQTSPENPRQRVHFTVSSPEQMGEYTFVVEARARNCNEGSFCTKTARGTLAVTADAPESGFSAYLFPRSINVKNLDTVLYTLTVQNYGKAKVLSATMKTEPATTTDFEDRDDVILLEDSNVTINFTVTPQGVSSLYEIEVTLTHEGLEKKASAFLSTNEMLTDAVRNGDGIKSQDPGLSGDVNSAIDSWYSNYVSSDYGDGLDSYETLGDRLAGLRNQAVNATQPDVIPGSGPGPDAGGSTGSEGINWMWIALPVIIVIVILILFVLFRKPEKAGEDGEYF
jgi:hypothetical protein